MWEKTRKSSSASRPKGASVQRASSHALSRSADDILLYQGHLVVFKSSIDVTFYVVGPEDENELMLQSALAAYYDAVSLLLRHQVEKRAILENLDLVTLCLDETVDDGWARPFLAHTADPLISRLSELSSRPIRSPSHHGCRAPKPTPGSTSQTYRSTSRPSCRPSPLSETKRHSASCKAVFDGHACVVVCLCFRLIALRGTLHSSCSDLHKVNAVTWSQEMPWVLRNGHTESEAKVMSSLPKIVILEESSNHGCKSARRQLYNQWEIGAFNLPARPRSSRCPKPKSSGSWEVRGINGALFSAELGKAYLRSQMRTPRSDPSVSMPAKAKVLLRAAPYALT